MNSISLYRRNYFLEFFLQNFLKTLLQYRPAKSWTLTRKMLDFKLKSQLVFSTYTKLHINFLSDVVNITLFYYQEIRN